MVKKIVLGTLFVGLIAALVAGGVIRTLDKTSQVAEAQGLGGYGHGRGAHDAEDAHTDDAWGDQGRYGAGNGLAGSESLLSDGQTITLRDQYGRPAWSGGWRGKGASAETGAAAPAGWGQRGGGYGARGQGWNGDGSHLVAPGGDLDDAEAEALQMALNDEYKAWSVYDQVIADFGAVQPFVNIQRAEESHIAALTRLMEAYGLDVPENPWPGNVPTFDTLADACAGGVQAELDNAALYDQLFSMVDNPDIVQVFTSLQQASLSQHLPAFERCSP